MKFRQALEASIIEESIHSKECLMLKIEDPKFLKWVADLPRRIEANDGNIVTLQDINDIHVTVAYGINPDFFIQTMDLVNEYKYVDLRLDPYTSYFNQQKGMYCLKIAVMSDVLQVIHNRLNEEGIFKPTFPLYHPHITIAYMYDDNVNLKVDYREQIQQKNFFWSNQDGSERLL